MKIEIERIQRDVGNVAALLRPPSSGTDLECRCDHVMSNIATVETFSCRHVAFLNNPSRSAALHQYIGLLRERPTIYTILGMNIRV